MSLYMFFQPTDEIFQKFDNYEIWPCVLLDQTDPSSYARYDDVNDVEDTDIAFWSIYGHFKTGGIECISGHETFKEAKEFMETLPTMPRTPLIPF